MDELFIVTIVNSFNKKNFRLYVYAIIVVSTDKSSISVLLIGSDCHWPGQLNCLSFLSACRNVLKMYSNVMNYSTLPSL